MTNIKVVAGVRNAKKLDTAIRKAKDSLIARAKKKGLYENFGNEEVDVITENFIDLSDYSDEMLRARRKVDEFKEWGAQFDESMLVEKPTGLFA